MWRGPDRGEGTDLAGQWSRHVLQSVLDGLTTHVCVLDESGTIVKANQAWREFAASNGGPADLIPGVAKYLSVCEHTDWLRSPNGEVADAFVRLLTEVLEGHREQFQLEYACHARTGQRWFVARVSRIGSGRLSRIMVAHDDVTALKQAQETLREGQALLLDLAASIPGAMFRLVHSAPGQWRYIYISPGVETLFEVTPEEAYSDNRALLDCILPEDRSAREASAREAAARGEIWQHESRIRTRSGRIKWIHVVAKPKRGEDGDLIWTGMLTDVSERKDIEAVLTASEATYRTLFETVPQGIVYLDTSGRIVSANPAALRILGLMPHEWQATSLSEPRWKAIHEDGSDFPVAQRPAMQALRSGQPVKDVVMGVSVPGQGDLWVRVSAMPLFRDGQLDKVYVTFDDVTGQIQLSRELERQAATDYLTGAANRRSLMDRLGIEFERILRHPELQCSVLALDFDHFKRVNDTWGHAAGDAALIQMTQLIRQETRLLDTLGRSGGEEFTILLPDTGPDQALAMAERLCKRVELTPVRYAEQTIPITVSIGVSVIAATDANPEAVLARADRALYQAKNGGRNAVRFFRETETGDAPTARISRPRQARPPVA